MKLVYICIAIILVLCSYCINQGTIATGIYFNFPRRFLNTTPGHYLENPYVVPLIL